MSHPPLPLSGGTFPPFGLSDVTLKHVRITTLEIEDVYARGQNWKWKKEFPRTLTVHVEQGRSAKQCETISFLNRPLQPASNFKLGRICFRSGNFQKLFCSPWTNFPALRFPLIVLVNHILDNLYLLLYHDTQKCYVRNSNWTDFPSTHCHFRFQIGKKKNFFLFQAKSLRV